jgi:hypothetical protein
MTHTEPPEDRFMDFVRYDDDDCWIWTAGINANGQNQFYVGGVMATAHRWAWEREYGEKPGRLRNLCGKKACVNPEHYQDIAVPPPPPRRTKKCACGCGRLTPRAWRSRRSKSILKGHQLEFIPGHGKRAPHATRRKQDPMLRFEKFVRREGDCWIWTGAISSYGRALFWYEGDMVHAHRVAWYLKTGDLPNILWRTCPHPACVNPDHYVTKRPR